MREKERERGRSQGDSSGLMFICGFISFTVWSSFTGRIISLSHSHIPPLRTHPPSLPAPSLSHSRQAIKILSATLLKNYGAPLVRVRVELLAIFSLTHDDRVRTYRALSFYLHLATSFYLFWFMSLRSLFLSHRRAVSTIRLLFRVYSLLGSLFPL